MAAVPTGKLKCDHKFCYDCIVNANPGSAYAVCPTCKTIAFVIEYQKAASPAKPKVKPTPVAASAAKPKVKPTPVAAVAPAQRPAPIMARPETAVKRAAVKRAPVEVVEVDEEVVERGGKARRPLTVEEQLAEAESAAYIEQFKTLPVETQFSLLMAAQGVCV